ncbi:single-stranded DNA-binding protein [Auritidibacter sp. NML100628]|uniref:single-stranded DNA-binding protein n=1 Tax=Auritidibacter sp. NML100628 TaxID=2170742 RepID=UPI000D737BE1|nr:single-stranded DNA-binding protein [Auritidibacter sp. NML100628]PXA77909.1 single-stranded DNA-binding protein [Auritidibacter sp. NML100628]
MAGETQVTVTGHTTGDAELRFTKSGDSVANFTVAHNTRTFDKNTQQWVDGDATFYRVTVFGKPAEPVAESVRKGDRVTVTGALGYREYQTKQGEYRSSLGIRASDVGLSLWFKPAYRSGGNGWSQPAPPPQAQQPPQQAQSSAPAQGQFPTSPPQQQQQGPWAGNTQAGEAPF